MDFHEEIYIKRNFAGLQQFRRDGLFCDVCLRCQEKLIYCHKNVLASQSNYFYKLLVDDDPDTREITMPTDASSHMTEVVVEFLYTGVLVIDATNFQDILKLHNLLEITEFEETLYKCLRKWIVPENIRSFVKSYKHFKNIKKLKEYFDHVFLHSFDVIKSDMLNVGMEFLNVINLLGRAEINVKEESSVHAFLIKWLFLHKEELTRKDPEEAMKLVRWRELDLQYLNDIYFNNELTFYGHIQKRLAVDAITAKKETPEEKDAPYDRSGQYTRALFSVASYDGSHLWELLRADVIEEEWFDLGECPIANTEKAKCAFMDGWLYVLGNNGDMLRYSVYIKKWEECRRTPYTFTRSNVFVNTSNELIVCGGDHATGRSVLRYEGPTDSWMPCPSMPKFCDRFSGAVINERLYIVGQSNQEDIVIQHYTSITNQWDVLEDSGNGPFDVPVSAAANNNMLYILGGSAPNEQNSEESSILFRFNPSFENATVLHPLPSCCINAKLVSVRDSIYSIGGIDKGEVLDVIHRYCPLNDMWTTLEWRFPFHTKRYCVTTHT